MKILLSTIGTGISGSQMVESVVEALKQMLQPEVAQKQVLFLLESSGMGRK